MTSIGSKRLVMLKVKANLARRISRENGFENFHRM
jgi:hypothetical protein